MGNKLSFMRLAVLGLAAGLAFSCSTPKEILYLQDLEQRAEEVRMNHENVIKIGDKIAILVSGQDKTVTAPYNQTLFEVGSGGGYSSDPEKTTIPYYVDENGNIDFPKIGLIHVAGMTTRELRDYIRSEITKDVKDATVYVNIMNFKIHIMGEVRTPGWYVIDADKPTTIFQALSKAGDLALTAQREGVIVLREENGVQTHYILDLRSTEVFDSPAYFVQQNDVIMVQPSARRVAAATANTGIWGTVLSSVSTSIAVVSLIINSVKK